MKRGIAWGWWLVPALLLVTFAGPRVSSQSGAEPSAPADLVLLDGRIWRGGTATVLEEALAIRGNRIVATGTTRQIQSWIGPSTRVVQLERQLVVPGFNDSHLHFLSGSLGLTRVDLTGAATVAEILARIQNYAQRHPEVPWILGSGWEYSRFPGGVPTKSYLDAIVPDRPVFLSAYDGHSGWANTAALKRAGIDASTTYEGFGEIVRNEAGEPTGMLKEGAQSLVRRLIPSPTRAEKLAALRQGLTLASSLGLTSLQNASGSPEELSLYEELYRVGELPVRFSMAFSVGEQTSPEMVDYLTSLKQRYERHPQIRAGSIKFMLDGVLESHTAALLDRYSDLPASSASPFGELAWNAQAYREMVATLDRRGFQLYTHAIGDRAVREALLAYELAQTGSRRLNARHRVEHIETLSPADADRFLRLGVLASMQPIHADPGTVDVWSRAVGPERLPLAFPWATLRRAGATLVFGSDWPACISLDPIRGLHNAVNRRTTDGHPPGGWIPAQRLSLTETLRAYTEAGAYATFDEQEKGRLDPGQLADLVVLTEDLFAIPAIRIHEARVRLTIFDGRIVYQAPRRP
ncbi:MAG: amidohydrolase [Blastocatellia bacterium]|jgi:predicted amidohydrolase YtcJ